MKRITFFLIVFTIVLQLKAQYNNDSVVLKYNDSIDKGYGGSEATTITPYVLFKPIDTQAYTGNKITHVHIGLKGNATNVYLYIKKSPTDVNPIYKQKIGNLYTGWNDITLTTPYDITGDSVTIGYKASFSSDNPNGVGYSSDRNVDADYVFWNSKSNWFTTGGSLCIQAVISGDKMPVNEMALKSLSSVIAGYSDKTVKLTGIISNMGISPVSKYELKYTVNDVGEQNLVVHKNVAVNQVDTFNIELPSDVTGKYRVKVTLASVNDQVDAYFPNDTISSLLTVRDKAYMKRVVVEEGTGTWCGWCPRGLVGLELMKKAYPEQFIPISVHGNDALAVSSYSPLIEKMSGFPDCYVDRKIQGDPYDDIHRMFEQEVSLNTHLGFNLQAAYNQDSTTVNVKASLISDANLDNPNYYAAFVVVEDSVKGYTQTNYYHDNSNGYMYGWEKKDESVSDVVYNDLARGIYSSYNGDICTPATMEAEKVYDYSYSFDLPSVVKNKKNVRVIGLLISPTTSYIVNAGNAIPISTTGIKNVLTPQVKSYKILEGELLVKLSDGQDSYRSVYIFTTEGKLIKKQVVTGDLISIDISGLHGIHFVKICNGHSSQTLKISI